MAFKNLTIISGGQTGVDRAALDFANENKIKCSGWCPKGRIAEDGRIAEFYPLKETLTSDYKERTRKNVEDSYGTLIIFDHEMDKGTTLTLELCNSFNKPYLLITLNDPSANQKVMEWIKNIKIKILNIAGPRESSERGIYEKTLIWLNHLFK